MSTPHAFPWLKAALIILFLVFWVLAETTRRDRTQHEMRQDSLDFAASDFIKAVLSLFLWFVSRWFQSNPPLSRTLHSSEAYFDDDIPLLGSEQEQGPLTHSDQSNYREPHFPTEFTLSFGNVRSMLPILGAGFVYTLCAYTDLRAREFVDPFTLYLVFPIAVLGVIAILWWRDSSTHFWHAAVPQFAGLFIARNALIGSDIPVSSLLVAFTICESIWISLIDVIYGLYHSSSPHLINALIFAQSCLAHSLLFMSYPSHAISQSLHDHLTVFQAFPLIEAAKGIAALYVIQEYGAVSQGILTGLAATFLITADIWKFIPTPYSGFIGCLIAILGSVVFVCCEQRTERQHPHDSPASIRWCFATAVTSLVALGYVVVVIFQYSGINPSDLSSIWRKLSGLSGDRPESCRMPELSPLIHAKTIANYTQFSNILLIVFFSHARYDGNLDFHREVYADYFPNIVYIGPATREDKGFAHSYDVLVDSFQSDEDLSDPLNYKMSGRMAHHMLYTALREYSCYDGYLWVPFDTLLNVPRLQQFNQSLFWYHSPWGLPVPNPALGAESELNISRHAPPAMISPDPYTNLTETWRGWGPDWWWGDPHVGVSVCMDAFHKVPAELRDNLARLNHGLTRLIGGSADTLYIPGRHRQAFMDVLARFLETNCFLEIATPTTVHLVLPPGEPIQFVDHWWIYMPPFNASFVRQKWAEGYEVDTFHTFHWGERDEDGVWKANYDHVADVRHLLRESAYRQGLGDSFPVHLDDGDDTSPTSDHT